MFNNLFENIEEREINVVEEKAKSLTVNDNIRKILNSSNKIYIGSDWHLWQWWDNKPWRNTSAEKILDKYGKFVTQDDAFIFLGDLVSGEITNKDIIRKDLSRVNIGHKIFVRGNNDLFDDNFYKENGFDEVIDRFSYNGTVFTHVPLEKEDFGERIHKNAHGHIHFSRSYCVKYFNHMDCFTKANNCKPLLIQDMYKNLHNGKYKPLII